jgi:hypothetical protein
MITYLAADTINGVYKIDPSDYPQIEFMNPVFFFHSLKSVEDDELIFFAFGEDDKVLLEKIETHYGIH